MSSESLFMLSFMLNGLSWVVYFLGIISSNKLKKQLKEQLKILKEQE